MNRTVSVCQWVISALVVLKLTSAFSLGSFTSTDADIMPHTDVHHPITLYYCIPFSSAYSGTALQYISELQWFSAGEMDFLIWHSSKTPDIITI